MSADFTISFEQPRDDQKRFGPGGLPSTRPAADKIKQQIRDLLEQMTREERNDFIDELDDAEV